jgi:hypothetical protein
MKRQLAALSALLLVASAGAAQEGADVPPPPVVDVAGAESPVDPEITIVEEEDRTIYEYRDNNGKLYMVKVVPKKGRPYYLLDTDGDGELDAQQYDPRVVAVQLWELLRW